MAWRLSKKEFTKQKGAGTKRAMKKMVRNDHPVGLLAYMDNEPVVGPTGGIHLAQIRSLTRGGIDEYTDSFLIGDDYGPIQP
jgi:hypothetical protein